MASDFRCDDSKALRIGDVAVAIFAIVCSEILVRQRIVIDETTQQQGKYRAELAQQRSEIF
jgi:hypothetical protein